LRGFRQALQFGAVTTLGRLFPLGNLAILLNFLQAVQDRLVRKIVKFLPAKIIVAPFHVADAEFAWASRKKQLLKEWDILKEELFLQVLGAGGDNHAFAAADHRQQISQGLARACSGL